MGRINAHICIHIHGHIENIIEQRGHKIGDPDFEINIHISPPLTTIRQMTILSRYPDIPNIKKNEK